MIFSKVKREFEIRYYLWAIAEFKKEIEESFPTMQLFKAGWTWDTYQFMQQLTKKEQLVLAHSLLKRFHQNAVQALGETCSPEEELLRSRRTEFPSNTLRFDEEIRARRDAGEKIKFASKRKLQKVLLAKFDEAFGGQCLGLASIDDDEPGLKFQMRFCGWIVNTIFYFGRRETILNYSHNIESEKTFPYRGGEVGMAMGWYMSFNSYLGIASQTEWRYITDEDIEPTCNAAIKLCGHFFEVLPKLLKGLNCENVKPDEGYELSDNPLR